MRGKLFFLEANPTDLTSSLVPYEPTTSVLNLSDTVTMSPTTLAQVTAEPKSTASISSDKECTCSNKVFIALFSISFVFNALLGIIVGFQRKKMQRNQGKNLQKEDLKNTNVQTRTISGNEISAYEEVVIDSGIHNGGIYDESWSDHKYEEPSNYEPLRRNPLQDQSDEHNYQSLTTSQKGK
ncbi:Hypothetical predicted protein [Paramuricea clavata]|uniref:Uncharacterized protein n=1 Tax=Paramuricea clavata TaxID=317549 RepID=A0A6S7L6X9_PARCT|nr:Hypothetical predicted protein [Paramuricea clavata]